MAFGQGRSTCEVVTSAILRSEVVAGNVVIGVGNVVVGAGNVVVGAVRCFGAAGCVSAVESDRPEETCAPRAGRTSASALRIL